MTQHPGISLLYLETETGKIDYSAVDKFEMTARSRGYAIKTCLKGVETYALQEQVLRVPDQSIAFINPDMDYDIHLDHPEPVLGICIDLYPGLLQRMAQPDAFVAGAVQPCPELPHLVMPLRASLLFPALQQLQYESDRLKDPMAAESFLMEFAHLLFAQGQRIQHEWGQIEARKVSTREELWRRLYRAADLMHDRFAEPLRLRDLAHEAKLSEFHFLRCFKQVFGQSPMQYLENIRLEHACALLRAGVLSLAHVADACGYNDTSYFSRRFKRFTGRTPGQFLRSRN